jgi:hypothetical protein
MQPTGIAGGGQPKDQSSSRLDLMRGELVQARDAPADVVTISNNHASHHHAPQYPPTALAHAQAHAARAHVGGGASGMAAGDQKVFDKLFEHGNGFVDEEPPSKPEGGEAKEEEKPKLPPVPLTQLWRFSSRGDKILLCFGCFCGVCLSLITSVSFNRDGLDLERRESPLPFLHCHCDQDPTFSRQAAILEGRGVSDFILLFFREVVAKFLCNVWQTWREPAFSDSKFILFL